MSKPTYGHCYVVDGTAGCGSKWTTDADGYPDGRRCGGLLSEHEAEHFRQAVSVEEAFEVIRRALFPGVKIENSQTNEEAIGFEPRW